MLEQIYVFSVENLLKEVLPLEEAIVELEEAEEERKKADERLWGILKELRDNI